MDIKSLPNNPEELKKIIEEMDLQLNNNLSIIEKYNLEIIDLNYKINILKKIVFGKKSEKWTREEKGQSLLFNEIECNLDENKDSNNENDKSSKFC